MKTTAIFFVLALASAGLAQDTPLHLSRHLTQGEVETYKLHMTGTTPQGDVDMLLVMKETVQKVNPDGGASIQLEYPDVKLTMAGQDVSQFMQDKFKTNTFDVDKNGVPVPGSDKSDDPGSMFRDNMPYYNRDWKPGDVMTLDPKTEKGTTTTEGTIKFIGTASDQAEFDSDLTVKTSQTTEAMNIKSKSFIDVGTSLLSSMDADIPVMPTQYGDITGVKFHLEHLKS